MQKLQQRSTQPEGATSNWSLLIVLQGQQAEKQVFKLVSYKYKLQLMRTLVQVLPGSILPQTCPKVVQWPGY